MPISTVAPHPVQQRRREVPENDFELIGISGAPVAMAQRLPSLEWAARRLLLFASKPVQFCRSGRSSLLSLEALEEL
jgi:hypothetical protein